MAKQVSAAGTYADADPADRDAIFWARASARKAVWRAVEAAYPDDEDFRADLHAMTLSRWETIAWLLQIRAFRHVGDPTSGNEPMGVAYRVAEMLVYADNPTLSIADRVGCYEEAVKMAPGVEEDMGQ